MLPTMILVAVALAQATPAEVASGLALRSDRSVVLNALDSGYVNQTSKGRVTLELWPQWRDTLLVVQIRANTHAVELGTVNLSEQVRLVVDGTEIAPVSAGRLSGHHAVAEVVFRLDERPGSFAITIRDVPDVPVRTLTWPPAPAEPQPSPEKKEP